MTSTKPLPLVDTGRMKRWLATWSRWLHVYLSMASFAILFFFAVTGLTLNHTEWFAGAQTTRQVKGSVKTEWLAGQVSKLEVVEQLRAAHAVRGALSDFRVDETQCAVSFKGPGYTADAFIDRANGRYELTETRMGFAAVMNDLHKGRDTGRIWSWIIDLSAVLMAVVSLSGLVLLFFLPKRLPMGLALGLIGAGASVAAYFAWVP